MKRFAILTALVLVVPAVAMPALAQKAAAPTPVAPVAPVVFNMDEDLIEGVVLTAPDVPVVGARARPAFRNLIQVRSSFAPELLASASKL